MVLQTTLIGGLLDAAVGGVVVRSRADRLFGIARVAVGRRRSPAVVSARFRAWWRHPPPEKAPCAASVESGHGAARLQRGENELRLLCSSCHGRR